MGEYNSGKWALLRKTFAISGIIQGFTWLVLALICVVMFFKKPDSFKYFTNVMISQYTPFIDLISFCFYDTLLDIDSSENSRALIPKHFHVIVWFYVALSICWFGLSIYECNALFNRKPRKYVTHNLMALGFITLLVCALDLVLFALAMHEFFGINPFLILSDDDCDFQANLDLQLRYRIGRKISFGVLMTLAARGFILWIFNCLAGWLSLTVSVKIFQMPPILQYDDLIPRPKIQRKRLLSESTRSSTATAYMNEADIFSTIPTQGNSWYYRASALETNNAAPKYLHPRNRHNTNSSF